MTEAKRNRLLLALCFTVYAISYIGKYSYSTNIQNVIGDLEISRAMAGYVSSAFFFCYGAGQIINGILCERLNSKYTLTLALSLSSAITISMFSVRSIPVMAVLWGLNGLLLSTLWCHCVKLLSTIRDKAYMMRSVTVMTATVPVGVTAAYSLSALFTHLGIWKFNYIFAGALLAFAAAGFLLLYGRLETADRELPELSSAEPEKAKKAPASGKNIFLAFGFSAFPLLAISVCSGLIRDGSATWMPVLLSDVFRLPDSFSILFTLGLPLVSVFTAVIATRLIHKTRSVFGSTVAAGACATAVGIVLSLAFDLSPLLLIPLFMLLSMSAYILVETITTIMPLYYKDKVKSGQTAGITNAFVYVGSTLSSLFLGGLTDRLGWRAFMIFMLVCSAIVSLLSVLGYLTLKSNKKSRY